MVFTTEHSRVIRFGAFEVDLRVHELRKHGLRIKLQEQPFQVLAMLLERPGDLITRDEIRAKLWPEDTFVDFDHGLNAAVRRLREALNDNADTPRFVETLPRRGYRFIFSVERVELAPQVVPPAQVTTPDTADSGSPEDGNRATATSGILKRRKPWVWAATAMVVFVATAGLILKWRSASRPAIDSLAVLPFLSADHNNDLDYLGDGIAESVMNNLSQVPGLKVMSRNSAFRYRQPDPDSRKIAGELGVRALLIGSVRQHDHDLRVSVELIDGRDEHQIWGEEYTRTLANLSGIQAEIASDVSQHLRLKLAPPVQLRIARRDTENSEAYRLYLKGKYALGKRTNNDIKQGLDYFQRAVELDPSYPLPYVGLSTSYGLLAFYGGMSPREAFPLEAAASRRALELDPGLADAHATRGFYLAHPKMQEAAAEAEFRRAVELSPNSGEAHHALSLFLMTKGHFDEAIAEGKKSAELDPLWLGSYGSLANVYYYAGQYHEAVELVETKAQRHAPSLWVAGVAYEAMKDYKSAIASMRDGIAVSGDRYMEADLARLYAESGETGQAKMILDRLLAQRKTEYFSAYKIATIYTGLRDDQQVFRWLRIACDEEDPWLARLLIDPNFAQYGSGSELADIQKTLLANASRFPD